MQEHDKEFALLMISELLEISEKARREGLLAIEEKIDIALARNMDILNLGLQLIVDGVDAEIVEDILRSINSHNSDPHTIEINNLIIEGILGIQRGDNPRIIDLKMRSKLSPEIRPGIPEIICS
jgi:flagellar motor component MotA